MFSRGMLARSGSPGTSPVPRQHPALEPLEPRLLLNGGPAGTDVLTFVQVVRDGLDGVDGLHGAISVTLSPDGEHVYATGMRDNALAVFARDEATGELSFVEKVRDGRGEREGLNGARAVTVSPGGNHVYVAGYWSDALVVYDRNPATGQLSFVEVAKDGSGGVDGLDGATSVTLSPDGSHVYAAGFSDNALAVFSRDEATGELSFVEVVRDGLDGVDGLGGARSVTLSPDGDHVYAAGFSDDALAVFTRDPATGELTFVEVVRDDAGGVDGLNGAISVTLSPDGGHVYAAGSSDDAIAVFSRDATTGLLSFVEIIEDNTGDVDGLSGVHSVAVSPDGTHVFAAGEYDSALAVFSRDVETGQLSFAEVVEDNTGGVDGLNAARSVTVSPDGGHVYAAGYYDDALAAFSRNPAAGHPMASVSGRKFEDRDGNAVRDPGEPYLNGWTIELVDASSGAVLATQITTSADADDNGTIDPETETGLYSFEYLPGGSYEVREVVQPGWVQTFPTPTVHSITLAKGQDLTDADFGNQAMPGEIHGTMWNDVDGDGVRDDGEPGLPDWKVFLDEDEDGQWDPGEQFRMTGADGGYAFTDLEAGTYIVASEARNGWVQTSPGSGQMPSPAAFQATAASELSTASEQAVFTAAVTTTGSTAPAYLAGEAVAVDDIDSIIPQINVSGPLTNIDAFRDDPRFAGIDGTGFATVIIDTGIDLDHPFFGPDADLDGVADRIVYSYDFADGDTDASDVTGHGSNTSSIVASSDETYTGMAPGADIIHLKVFADSGDSQFSYIEDALQWVVANAVTYNIASVNMSISDKLNYTTPQSLYGLSDELAALAAANVVVASVSGNRFYTFGSAVGVCYPSADANSLSIGAVYDSDFGTHTYSSGAKAYSSGPDRIAPFSQRHPTLTTVFAPGAPITGAGHDGGTKTYHGTSQASPHISGIAVLAQQLAMQTLGRRLRPAEVSNLLQATGATVNDGDDEDDNVTNTGLDFARVDVLALGEGILAMAGDIERYHLVVLQPGQVVTGLDFGNYHLTSAIPDAPDMLDGDDTGQRQDDDITSHNEAIRFEVTGTRDGAVVTIYADGEARGTAVAAGETVVVTTDGGFDLLDGQHAITARQIEPGRLVSGYSAALTVTIDTNSPTFSAWYSAADHGGGVGEAKLEIAGDELFSEPRSDGVSRLLIDFSEPIATDTLVPGAVEVWGNADTDGEPEIVPDDITPTITTSTRDSQRGPDTVGVIEFTPALANFMRYLVNVIGLTDIAGNLAAGQQASRVILTLIGDVSGDRRVTSADLSIAWATRTSLIDPDHPTSGTRQVRSDVSVDGHISPADLSLAWGNRGDARGIAVPTPGNAVQNAPQVQPAFAAPAVAPSAAAVVASSPEAGGLLQAKQPSGRQARDCTIEGPPSTPVCSSGPDEHPQVSLDATRRSPNEQLWSPTADPARHLTTDLADALGNAEAGAGPLESPLDTGLADILTETAVRTLPDAWM